MNDPSETKLDDRYIQALGFAAQLHDGQTRKGSQIHYLSHLLSVSALVMENGGSDNEAIAALLHDSLEDQGDEYHSSFKLDPRNGRDALKRDLALLFGNQVLQIVIGCTDDEDHITGVVMTKDGTVSSWRNRKEAYLDRLAASSDVKKTRVSVADKLHNSRCILLDFQEQGLEFWDRFTAGPIDQVWYYTELGRVFEAKAAEFSDDGIRRMTQELRRIVGRIEQMLPSPSKHCLLIIEHLEQIEQEAGVFTAAFPQLHHFHAGGGNASLSAFKKHCESHEIREGTNLDVYRRLFHVQRQANRLIAADSSTATMAADKYTELVNAAVGEYPFE